MKFKRQENYRNGWIIDYNILRTIKTDPLLGPELPMSMEDIELILLRLERVDLEKPLELAIWKPKENIHSERERG